jgi:hypothetical protein
LALGIHVVVVEILDQDQEVTLEEDLVSSSSKCSKGKMCSIKKEKDLSFD